MISKKTTNGGRGFTMFELVISFAILSILLAVILPPLIDFRRASLLNTDTQSLVTLTNRARVLSIASKDDSQYGVHLEAGKIVLFKGITYSVNDPTNETHTFGSGLTLSNIAINGGGSEVVFEKITGATTQNATTTLLVTDTTASSTVVVGKTGIVTVN